MIFFAITVFLILLLMDLPALIREKSHKELAVFIVLSGVTLVYFLLYAQGKEPFSPIKSLSRFVEDVLGLSYELWQGHA